MNATLPSSGPAPGDPPTRTIYFRLLGYALVLMVGVLIAEGVRFVTAGTTVQLSPETFVSLVFTIAIGAAALILALMSISSGRLSEKVMTERADRSIDIQLTLFQKSLDLQTQVFEKTMSTLESISRSTGVTEQRLGDVHSLLQSPTFLKQVTGKAVEETTSELGEKGKQQPEGVEAESRLAERLTQNIVRELASRLEGLERSRVLETYREPRSFSLEVEKPEAPPPGWVTDTGREILKSISGASIEPPDTGIGYWDFVVSYKTKKIAFDFRTTGSIRHRLVRLYDESIKELPFADADCLVFVFTGTPDASVVRYIENRSNTLQGKSIRVIAYRDETALRNELIAALESVVGLPKTT